VTPGFLEGISVAALLTAGIARLLRDDMRRRSDASCTHESLLPFAVGTKRNKIVSMRRGN
jgi:hypothetical protein